VNERIVTQHIEYEPQAYMYAFTIELEISAAAMWCFVSHLKPNVSKCVELFYSNKFFLLVFIRKVY
jgi:hypothetical protein